MIYAILIMGVLLVFISAYGHRLSTKTAADYLMAGRSIGTIVLFFYVYFAISSTWTFYGFPGTVYNTGPGFQLFFIFIPFAFLYIFLGPKLWAAGRLYGFFSPVEYLGERYQSSSLRVLLAVCLFLFLFPYLGIQTIGVAAGITAATGIPFWFGIVYMSIVMIIIVFLGGTKSVAWVNVFLGSLFIFTFVGFLLWVCLLTDITSLSQAARRILEMNPKQLSVPGPANAWGPKELIGLAIAGITVFAWPHVVIGTMQAKSITVMRKMTMAMLGFSIIFCGAAMIWGSIVTPLLVPGLKGKAADAVVQIAITKNLPEWASAVTLLAVIAAALSTAAVQLMVAGLFASRDIVFVGKTGVKDSHFIIVARLGMIVSVVGSTVLALTRPTELGLMLSNLASPGFAQWLPAFVGGLLWRRGTREGAITGLIVGISMLTMGNFFYKPLLLGFHPIVIPLLVNTVLYIGISLATAPVSKDIERKYFDDIEDWLLETRTREREQESMSITATQSSKA
ncbi:MAG: sodium:solute symporter family protein [Bacillota bacterium]